MYQGRRRRRRGFDRTVMVEAQGERGGRWPGAVIAVDNVEALGDPGRPAPEPWPPKMISVDIPLFCLTFFSAKF